VTAPLELPEDTFGRHLALEMLDGPLDAFVADGDLEGPALNGFGRIRQGTGDIADLPSMRKVFCPEPRTPLDRSAESPKITPMPDDARVRPLGVKAPHGSRVLEIRWGDGAVSQIPHEVLRGYCPCAGCQGHSGSIRYLEGANLELTGIEQVGNYALQLSWGDAHATGIYSFRYLRRLSDLVAEHGSELPRVHPELPAP
jgi:DUF971 family protein